MKKTGLNPLTAPYSKLNEALMKVTIMEISPRIFGGQTTWLNCLDKDWLHIIVGRMLLSWVFKHLLIAFVLANWLGLWIISSISSAPWCLSGSCFHVHFLGLLWATDLGVNVGGSMDKKYSMRRNSSTAVSPGAFFWSVDLFRDSLKNNNGQKI